MEKKTKETLTTHFKMLTLVVKSGLSFRHFVPFIDIIKLQGLQDVSENYLTM